MKNRIVLVGAGQGDLASYNQVRDVIGRNPDLFMDYVSSSLHWSGVKSRINQLPKGVGVNLAIGWQGGKDLDVSKGSYDSLITQITDYIISSGRHFVVRLAYEMDLKSNGYINKYFDAAFSRLAKILRKSNAEIVLCSGGGSSSASMSSIVKWLPKDLSLVDQIGWDFFAGEIEGLKNFDRIKSVDDWCKLNNKKMMLGECAPRGSTQEVPKGQQSWDKYFVPLFNVIDQLETIVSFSYINWDWTSKGWIDAGFKAWGDSRLQTNSLVAKNFAERLTRVPFIEVPVIEEPPVEEPPVIVDKEIDLFTKKITLAPNWSIEDNKVLITSSITHGGTFFEFEERDFTSITFTLEANKKLTKDKFRVHLISGKVDKQIFINTTGKNTIVFKDHGIEKVDRIRFYVATTGTEYKISDIKIK